jgi:polyvinyl alcohol dehydrogenase (cytochrome)
MMDRTVSKLAIVVLLAVCISFLITARAHSRETPLPGERVPMQPDWASSGQNNHNTRYAAAEHTINAGDVGNLKTAWIFTTAGDVSATAIVVKGVVYFPDWGGKLWAIDTKTGKAIWSHNISEYTGTAGSASRSSPAYWNGELVIGTGNLMTPNLGPAFEIGIDARSGSMLWRTQTDANQAAIVTGSATIDNGIVYTGVSSKTEHTKVTPTFRGSVEALDARTGKILWKTYMVPLVSTVPPCGAASPSLIAKQVCCTSPPATATRFRMGTA